MLMFAIGMVSGLLVAAVIAFLWFRDPRDPDFPEGHPHW